jgi:co-chaperonin GroES (HSP10)
MSFKPLQDYVLIMGRDVAEAQYGGIIIPDTAKDKPQEGEVLAVGPGKRLDGGGGLYHGCCGRQHGVVWEVRWHGDQNERRRSPCHARI